jgi:hypothetical protein
MTTVALESPFESIVRSGCVFVVVVIVAGGDTAGFGVREGPGEGGMGLVVAAGVGEVTTPEVAADASSTVGKLFL